jgi:hypothetical protein
VRRSPIPITMAATPIEPAEQRTLVVPEWAGAQFPAARDDEQEVYLPVRALCLFLGITGSGRQIAMLQSDRVLRKHLRKFFIRGSGGRQPAWCINLRALAFWLARVDIDAVRPELQDGLVEWQEALLEEAHRLFWGAAEPVVEDVVDPRLLQQRIRSQDAEIRRLKLQVRTHARRLAALERYALPPDVYYDVPGDSED